MNQVSVRFSTACTVLFSTSGSASTATRAHVDVAAARRQSRRTAGSAASRRGVASGCRHAALVAIARAPGAAAAAGDPGVEFGVAASAIASGVRAPMSRPSGARSRPSSARRARTELAEQALAPRAGPSRPT